MCGRCGCGCLLSAIATWGFFALLLSLLNVGNALLNALWLTALLFIAIVSCPILNPKITEYCKPAKKKKK